MKPWTQDTLILFYYGELDAEQSSEIERALNSHNTEFLNLQKEYSLLVELLDNSYCDNAIPIPRADLNHFIMAGIESENSKKRVTTSWFSLLNLESLVLHWRYQIITAGIACTALVALLVFHNGEAINNTHFTAPAEFIALNQKKPTLLFDATELTQAGKRVFLAKVLQHLENNDRLFTQIKNDNELSTYLSSREALIAELIMVNRLYRLASAESKDYLLMQTLEQIEVILQTLNHSDLQSEGELSVLRERLNRTDVLFKIRSTKNAKKSQII